MDGPLLLHGGCAVFVCRKASSQQHSLRSSAWPGHAAAGAMGSQDEIARRQPQLVHVNFEVYALVAIEVALHDAAHDPELALDSAKRLRPDELELGERLFF